MPSDQVNGDSYQVIQDSQAWMGLQILCGKRENKGKC